MIEAEGLTKHFTSGSGKRRRTVEAVRGIDLRVDPGELVAVLGPNGAGKSTMLRMLTTLLPPTAGRARVAGIDVRQDPAGVRRRIGYIGQGNGAGHSYRVDDELHAQGRFYGLDRTVTRRRTGELLAALDLEGLAKRKVSTLSGGQRRRLDIALGLLHQPDLLFLDEPTTGMDPQNRANLWEHVQSIRDHRGSTILLTTHYLEEADSMAERVVVIDAGRVIADDTAAALKATLGGDRLTVGLQDTAPDALERAEAIVRRWAADGTVHRDPADRRRMEIRTESGSARLPRLLAELERDGLPARTASVAEPTLDDVFLTLTGRSLRAGQ